MNSKSVPGREPLIEGNDQETLEVTDESGRSSVESRFDEIGLEEQIPPDENTPETVHIQRVVEEQKISFLINGNTTPQHDLSEFEKLFKSFGPLKYNRSQRGPTVAVVDSQFTLYSVPTSSVSSVKAYCHQKITITDKVVDCIVIGQFKSAETTKAVITFYADQIEGFLRHRLSSAPEVDTGKDYLSDNEEPNVIPECVLLNINIDELVAFGRCATNLPAEDPHGEFAVIIGITNKRVSVVNINKVQPKIRMGISTVTDNNEKTQCILISRFNSQQKAEHYVFRFKESAIVKNNVDFGVVQGVKTVQPLYVIPAAPCTDVNSPSSSSAIVSAIEQVGEKIVGCLNQATKPTTVTQTSEPLDKSLPVFQYVCREYVEQMRLYAGNQFASKIARAIFTVNELQEDQLNPLTEKAREYFRIVSLFSQCSNHTQLLAVNQKAKHTLMDLTRKAKKNCLPPTNEKEWRISRPRRM